MSCTPQTTQRMRYESSIYTLDLFEKSFKRMIADIDGLPWWVKSSLPFEARVRLLQLWPLLYRAELDRGKMSVIMNSAARVLKEQFCGEFFFRHPKAFQESLEFQVGVNGEALPSARALFMMLSYDGTLDSDLSERSGQDNSVRQFRRAS